MIRVLHGDTAASLEQWRDRISRALQSGGGRSLKQDVSGQVAVLDLDGAPAVLKRRPMASLFERLRAATGFSRYSRQWHGAQWLLANKLRAPRPLARGVLHHHEHHSGSPEEFLLLEYIPGRTVLQHLADGELPPRREHAIARAIADDLVRFFVVGRYNRDHKPSNLLVVEAQGAGSPPQIAILDSDSIRPSTVANLDSAERMLAALVIEAIGCRCEPRRTLKARVIHEFVSRFERLAGLTSQPEMSHHERRARIWRRVARRVASHGDTTPAVDPLEDDDD